MVAPWKEWVGRNKIIVNEVGRPKRKLFLQSVRQERGKALESFYI